jgi:hypothetical protein
MRWNPYIELFAEVSRAARAKCKQCGADIDRGDWRARAIPVIGKPELLHLDCAAKRAPDLVKRKLIDEAPDWPEEARERVARFVPEDVTPAPRSYQRTPITDVSYAKDASGHKDCEYCGLPCPGEKGPTHGHGVRAFFLGGEYLFHPLCVMQLAPGICRRVTLEGSERWPAEVKELFTPALVKIAPTPRSPWKNTAGIPKLEPAPSGRAACRFCKGKIGKGELRLAREQLYGMRRSPVYFHVACYCKSADYHPKILELVALRANKGIAREEIAALADGLPPTPEEDDDVPPLLERMLALFDSIPKMADASEDAPEDKLTENVVEIPKGFFNS